MKNSVLNLLRSALVPVLRTDVAASTTGNVHLRLVTVFTMRTLPNEFAFFVLLYKNFPVVTADLAIVALGVKLGIHDVVVNKLHERKHRRDIVLHVGYFYVGNCAARGKLLEFALKFELGKGVDFFRNVYVVAVGDIALIRYPFDDAETLLQTFRELIGGTFKRRAVQREVDIFLRLPYLALVVHLLHNRKRKRLCLFVRMRFSRHILDAFVKPCVAEGNGRIAAV